MTIRTLPRVGWSEVAATATDPVYTRIHRIIAGPGEGWPHSVGFHQVSVVIAGRGLHVSARGTHPIEQGAVIVTNPGVWQTPSDCDIQVAILGIATEPLVDARWRGWTDLFGRALRSITATPYPERVRPQVAHEFTRELRRLERVLAERPDFPLMILGQIMMTIGVLRGAMSATAPPQHPAVAAVIDTMEADLARPWRLADLARVASVDPSYLGKVFRNESGSTPMDYLARLRVDRAMALLGESRLSIGQVGAAVGWDDPAHFARRFRRLTGVTPRTYRASVRCS